MKQNQKQQNSSIQTKDKDITDRFYPEMVKTQRVNETVIYNKKTNKIEKKQSRELKISHKIILKFITIEIFHEKKQGNPLNIKEKKEIFFAIHRGTNDGLGNVSVVSNSYGI